MSNKTTNFIGISGKIGSGKDTVAGMIRYLTTVDNPTFKEFKSRHINDDQKLTNPEWEIKRFADKLKDMVCLLIGCSREQLEDREFKEKPLGEEWTKWKLSVTTDAKDLYFSTEEEALEFAPTYGLRMNVTHDPIIQKVEMTPRKLMQLLGTEAGRDIIHPNIWVNALFANYNPPMNKVGKAIMEGYTGDKIKYQESKWIIPDTRFPNEARAIKDRGGILIRVERERDKRLPELKGKTVSKKELHPSETSLDNWEEWDYVIYNNFSMRTLFKSVKEICEEENII